MVREHAVGDFVTYRQNGICKISKIVKQDFAGMGEREYYELTPVYDAKTVIFVPLDSESLKAGMRHILSADEIDSIIAESDNEEIKWIDDSKERAQTYNEILLGGDRQKILYIIKVLTLHKKKLEENKKKLYAGDAKVLSAAEKAITEEFSFVLGIERGEVIPYILGKLGK